MSAKACKVAWAKKGPMKAPPGRRGVGPMSGTDFQIQDDGHGNATVFGVDAAGYPVPLDSSAVTIAVSSSDPTIYKVDTPNGVTFAEHGVKPGTATGTVVATWNDGSIGPFTGAYDVTVTPGGPTGLIVTHS